MKNTALPLSARIRLAILKGVARLLAWAIAPTLKPATIATGRGAPRRGRVIDGEFRRLNEPNHW